MKECFVIMGFREKADPDTGRVLNLDATYEHIIKPGVEDAGLKCIRADEILHSGIIDRPMYEKLLTADFVVADITTANANAIYELGVRHALRPRATIVIKEAGGKRYFDLDHLATISYEHLGKDIGASEARKKSRELRDLILTKLAAPTDDSPVYTFLNGLTRPQLPPPAPPAPAPALGIGGRRSGPGVSSPAAAAVPDRPAGPTLAETYASIDEAMKASDFTRAAELLNGLRARGSHDPSLLQKLALATYKSKQPTERAALDAGWKIVAELGPERTTDAETLGLAGAIRKRMWALSGDNADLDDAIAFYGRGWVILGDSYNGENYADCLEERAATRPLDLALALRVREEIVAALEADIDRPGTSGKGDYPWMLATLANCLRALGDDVRADGYEARFRALHPLGGWEIDTFEQSKAKMAARAKRYAELRARIAGV